MSIALGIIGGGVVGASVGVWIAGRQEEGWALILPLGLVGGVIGAAAGGVAGAVL